MNSRSRMWALPAAVGALGLAWLLGTDTPLDTSVLIVAVVGIQTWAGAYLWRLICGKSVSIIETLGMGMALGTAIAVLAGLSFQLAGLGNWGWWVPSLAALVVWGIRRSRGRRLPSARNLDGPALTALVVGALAALIALWLNVLRYPLSWTGIWSNYHPDMLFFEALSTSIARLGPLDSIFLAGGTIRYHWLVYGWAGQISLASSAEPFVVLTRALPFVVSAMAVLLAVAWTRRLTKVGWAPTLSALLIITGGYVGASYGTILNFDSPSQAFTSAWLIALAMAFLRLARPSLTRGQGFGLLAALLILSFSIAGGKVSTAAIAATAVAFVTMVGMLGRTAWWRSAFAGAAMVGIGSFAGFWSIVFGSADPGGLRLGQLLERASSVQGLNPLPGSLGILAGTVILVIAIGFRWIGVLWLVSSPRSRWQPYSILAVGFVIAGLGSIVLISGGLNDTWFALAASAPLSILSAAGVARAAHAIGAANTRTRPSNTVMLAAVAALVIAGITSALWLTGGSGGNVWQSTQRWLGPLAAVVLVIAAGWLLARSTSLTGRPTIRWFALAILVAVFTAVPFRLLGFAGSAFGVQPETGLSADAFVPREPFVDSVDTQAIVQWNDQWNEAGQLLRASVAEGQLVATNVTFSPIVPALSGAATFVSGIQYQAPYGRAEQLPELISREQQLLDFLANPTEVGLRNICAQGVRWLWIDPNRGLFDAELSGVAPVVDDMSVQVYRLNDC